MITDTTFFTNEPGSTLLDRFRKTLRDARYFDIREKEVKNQGDSYA